MGTPRERGDTGVGGCTDRAVRHTLVRQESPLVNQLQFPGRPGVQQQSRDRSTPGEPRGAGRLAGTELSAPTQSMTVPWNQTSL